MKRAILAASRESNNRPKISCPALARECGATVVPSEIGMTRKAGIAQLAERHPCEVKTPVQFVAPGTILGPFAGAFSFVVRQILESRFAFACPPYHNVLTMQGQCKNNAKKNQHDQNPCFHGHPARTGNRDD